MRRSTARSSFAMHRIIFRRCSALKVVAAMHCASSLLVGAVATSAPTVSRSSPPVVGLRVSPWPPLACPSSTDTALSFGVLVYGGTAGGVVAAVASSRTLAELGDARGVAILNPTAHLGGMVSGGLGKTDGGPSGGIAAEFFKDVGGLMFPPSASI